MYRQFAEHSQVWSFQRRIEAGGSQPEKREMLRVVRDLVQNPVFTLLKVLDRWHRPVYLWDMLDSHRMRRRGCQMKNLTHQPSLNALVKRNTAWCSPRENRDTVRVSPCEGLCKEGWKNNQSSIPERFQQSEICRESKLAVGWTRRCLQTS